MQHWMCSTCGSQFSASDNPPPECPVCLDQRQYIGHNGQQWTTREQLQQNGSHNEFKEHEAGLMGIGTTPTFAIGQRALLLQTPQGNVLWDCISFLDDETITKVRQLGGIQAIAISHPHYYSAMVDWAEAFDAPIYLHEADRKWVMRPSERITFWFGETYPLWEGVSLLRLGGHFAGGTVLYQEHSKADGKGIMLAGDIISVVADRRWVSFMYSYPDLIPLSASAINLIRAIVAACDFERLYSAWFTTIVSSDAKHAVMRSADRYLRALQEILPDARG